MKIFSKFIISFFVLILFLSPFSIQKKSIHINELQTDTVQSQQIVIEKNITHAQIISTGECDGDFDTWDSCISDGIFYVYELLIFYLTNVVLVITGLIFDIILFFSLNSNFYRGGLMESGWSIVRDFTNIIFIFALLTMAFRLVLNQDNGKTKSSLIKTILIALTINFSLFMSYIIIDGSNLLAFTFYNRIEASGQYQSTVTGQGDENSNALTTMVQNVTAGQPSLSLAVASKINPQTIITSSGADGLLQKFVIVTSAGILNILLIYVFGSIALLFLGRSLGLMVSGIMAPLAFASITVPTLQSLPYVGFGSWLKQLLSLAFMAPIFLFLMYLIVTFLGDEGVLRGLASAGGDDFLSKILTVFIFFMIIGGLMLLAKKITTTMAGQLGGMVSQGITGLTSGIVAAGAIAATGGAALAGTAARGAGLASKGVGAGLKKFGGAKSKLYGESFDKFGKKFGAAGKRLQSQKIDPTKSKIFNAVAGKEVSGMIGAVTSKSALGHVDDALNGPKIVDNEYTDLQKAKLDRAKKKAQKKADNSKTAEDWEKELNKVKQGAKDKTAKSKIEDERDTTKVDNNGNPDPSSSKTFEEYAKEMMKELNKAALVNISGLAENPPGYLAGAPIPPSLTGDDRKVKNNESPAQFEERVIKQYDKDKKEKEKEIKQEERVLAKANAEGNTALASFAEANIRAMEGTLETIENNKDSFEKATSKKQKEKISAQRKGYEGQAREKIAQEYESNNDQETADRIRSGEVKTEKTEDKKK